MDYKKYLNMLKHEQAITVLVWVMIIDLFGIFWYLNLKSLGIFIFVIVLILIAISTYLRRDIETKIIREKKKNEPGIIEGLQIEMDKIHKDLKEASTIHGI